MSCEGPGGTVYFTKTLLRWTDLMPMMDPQAHTRASPIITIHLKLRFGVGDYLILFVLICPTLFASYQLATFPRRPQRRPSFSPNEP